MGNACRDVVDVRLFVVFVRAAGGQPSRYSTIVRLGEKALLVHTIGFRNARMGEETGAVCKKRDASAFCRTCGLLLRSAEGHERHDVKVVGEDELGHPTYLLEPDEGSKPAKNSNNKKPQSVPEGIGSGFFCWSHKNQNTIAVLSARQSRKETLLNQDRQGCLRSQDHYSQPSRRSHYR